MQTTADVLDYRVIASDVRNLRIATDNMLERGRHARLDGVPKAQRLVHSMFKVTANVFQAVMLLCADSDADPARRPELAVAAPPLLRVLADSLFTVIFLFDDLPTNVPWYWTSGWHEMDRRYTQWEERHRNDPDWTDLLDQQCRFIERAREDWGFRTQRRGVPREEAMATPRQDAERGSLSEATGVP